MELHLVHYKSIYSSLSDALAAGTDSDAVAVMAVLFKVRYSGGIIMLKLSCNKNQDFEILARNYKKCTKDIRPIV